MAIYYYYQDRIEQAQINVYRVRSEQQESIYQQLKNDTLLRELRILESQNRLIQLRYDSLLIRFEKIDHPHAGHKCLRMLSLPSL